MDSIWDREVYESIFGKYPDGDHEVLEAVQGEDGVYRVPTKEEPKVIQWTYMNRYASAYKDNGIIHITGA